MKCHYIKCVVSTFFANEVYLCCRYEIVRPPDGAWGIPNDKGEWNGMIGMVKRNVGLSISQNLI